MLVLDKTLPTHQKYTLHFPWINFIIFSSLLISREHSERLCFSKNLEIITTLLSCTMWSKQKMTKTSTSFLNLWVRKQCYSVFIQINNAIFFSQYNGKKNFRMSVIIEYLKMYYLINLIISLSKKFITLWNKLQRQICITL